MATLRSLLDRFSSIRRPSLSSAGSGSYSSLAKKQATAEDAIADNMYSSGDLSAEAYKTQLNQRLLRAWNTPAQVVSIKVKLNDVAQTLQDTQINADYAAGKYTTSQILDYEKQKLNSMSEPNSAAYVKQQQKIQGLQDKMEKENRAAFRVSENLRISNLPEDTSASILEKARLYQTLSDQARLDGDTQQADSLLTQANNYTNSAKRADINDLITSTRLSVSESPTEGRGVPSAESGLSFLDQLLGKKTAVSGNTAEGGVPAQGGVSPTTPSAASTGFSGYSSPAVQNKLKTLDRQKMTLDRLYQDQDGTANMIQTYRDAVARASGDQKTQLTIALNNLIDKADGIQSSIDNTTQGITDTVIGIQEAQQKVAASSFNQEVRTNNLQFTKAESDLENAFKTGKINKQEYIEKGATLAATKTQFFEQASGIYNQFGNDSSAESYLQKSQDMQGITESLINVYQNLDDYEPVFNDSSSNLTNLLGKKINKGDVILQDVRQLKDGGKWDQNYTRLNGVYHRIYYKDLPDEYKDAQGYALPNVANTANVANFFNNAYVYNVDKEGQVVTENVAFVKYSDGQGGYSREAVPESRLQRLVADKAVVKDKKGDFVGYEPQQTGALLKAAAGTQALMEKYIPGAKNAGDKFRELITPTSFEKQWMVNPLSPITSYITPLVEKAKGTIGSLFQKAKDFATRTISSVNPVKPALAADLGVNIDSPYADAIASAFGQDAADALRVIQGENVTQDPRARNKNSDGSEDRGLFQINSNTFNDFWNRKQDVLRAAGINNYNDMWDPVKNAKMARIIKDEQGWKAWYGAPDDLVNPTPAPTATPLPTSEPKSVVSNVQAAGSNPQVYARSTSSPITARDVVSEIPKMASFVGTGVSNLVSNAAKNVSTYFNPTSNQGNNFWSTPTAKVLGNIQSSIQKVTQPVVNTVKNTVSNIGNTLKKLKFW
jgi:hypothetical protein